MTSRRHFVRSAIAATAAATPAALLWADAASPGIKNLRGA